jgi:hypothetical protein
MVMAGQGLEIQGQVVSAPESNQILHVFLLNRQDDEGNLLNQ